MTLILDAGAFIAVDHGDREVVALVKRERLAGRVPLTHGGVVGQVWRGGGGRQTITARLLAGVEIVPLDDDLGRRAGLLLGRAHASDVVDAALVALGGDDDEILTSDATDLQDLASAAGVQIEVVPL